MYTETFKWKFKRIVNINCKLYESIFIKLAKRKELFVNENTDITVEGFPRSGNTYAVALLKYITNNNLNIARHRHEICHVFTSLKLGKPVILLFRNPIEAVISLKIREKVSLSEGFKYYTHFYGSIIKINKISDYLLLYNFNDLIKDNIKFLNLLNNRFNLNLKIPQNLNAEEIKRLVIKMDENEIKKNRKFRNLKDKEHIVSIPSENKEKLKKFFLKEIENSDALKELSSKALYIYKTLQGLK